MKRTPLRRKTPLRVKRPTPRRNEGRVDHGRMKRKATDYTALEEAHVARLKKMRCVVTGKQPVDVHHLMKAPDKRCRRDHRWTVPLHGSMHNRGDNSVHGLGTESMFEVMHGLKPGFLIETAERLWRESCMQIGAEKPARD